MTRILTSIEYNVGKVMCTLIYFLHIGSIHISVQIGLCLFSIVMLDLAKDFLSWTENVMKTDNEYWIVTWIITEQNELYEKIQSGLLSENFMLSIRADDLVLTAESKGELKEMSGMRRNGMEQRRLKIIIRQNWWQKWTSSRLRLEDGHMDAVEGKLE